VIGPVGGGGGNSVAGGVGGGWRGVLVVNLNVGTGAFLFEFSLPASQSLLVVVPAVWLVGLVWSGRVGSGRCLYCLFVSLR
jgi:hypothetical protein